MASSRLSIGSVDILKGVIEHIEKGRNQDVIKILKEYPKLLNEEDKTKKKNPLVAAIKCKNIEIIKFLIKEGADVNKDVGQYPEPPSFHAIETNNAEVMKLILEKCDVTKIVGSCKNSALHEAIERNSEVALSILMRQPNINLNIQNKNHETPLHLAVRKQRLSLAKKLMEDPEKINFDLEDGNGFTANTIPKDNPTRQEVQKVLDLKKLRRVSGRVRQEENSPPYTDLINNGGHVFDFADGRQPQEDEEGNIENNVDVQDGQDNDALDVERNNVIGSPDSFPSMDERSPSQVDSQSRRSEGEYSVPGNRYGMGSLQFGSNPPDVRRIVVPNESLTKRFDESSLSDT